jgi:hypothetical protein
VLGDRRDRSVPSAAWEAWVAAARRAGLRVHAAEVDGLDRPELGGGESRHLTTARGMEVASACAAGAPPERILQALRSDEPLLAPRGRRLGAGEIRAAVAGRSLRGNEWSPRADVSSFWGAGGELFYLDLRRGARRIAELRWRVEGDRLCTTRHGCGEVLSDGRFLNVVKGEPPRLSVTLLEDGPAAPSAAVADAAPTPAPAPPARCACWSASAWAATRTGSRAWRRRRCASGSAGRSSSRTCPGGRARARRRRWPGQRRTAPRSACSRRRW